MRNNTMRNFPDQDFIIIATKHFLENGGQIKILPPQKVVSRAVVSRSEWAAYESLDDFLV